MAGFRMLVEGVGDAFSQRYYSSCFALESETGWIQVDCPHPFRKILKEATEAAGITLDLQRLEGVILTHLHADHSSGLEGLIFYFRYVLGKKLRLLAHPEVAADLWPRCLAGSMEWSRREPGGAPVQRRPDELYELVLLSEDKNLSEGSFMVRCRKTLHSIPTVALRFEGPGSSLGYSADTAFDPSLIEWLNTADLIIHEASSGAMHTSLQQLTTLPEAVQEKMRLIHYPDDLETGSSPIEVLRQGQLYLLN
jgi:ribonuclease BN (tRNA processing enzyme)